MRNEPPNPQQHIPNQLRIPRGVILGCNAKLKKPLMIQSRNINSPFLSEAISLCYRPSNAIYALRFKGFSNTLLNNLNRKTDRNSIRIRLKDANIHYGRHIRKIYINRSIKDIFETFISRNPSNSIRIN
ncbi:hypothetical protein D9M71_473090 [compost metagenome]